MLRTEDLDRVRTITLARSDALNAFDLSLRVATIAALRSAAADSEVAVVILTGSGRAFSAGADVVEMADRTTAVLDPTDGFPALIDAIAQFPKPLLFAVNGLALGIGATILGLADLVFMASDARVQCPFTALALVPEAGSSLTFPLLIGKQHASWVLLSSDWFSADECREMGLAWKVCASDELLAVAAAHARVLAARAISSLVESKRTIAAAYRDALAAARARETEAYRRLLGKPANVEALSAVLERREPNFKGIDGQL
jgi:enoyl-CoA hydratase/carnithine racemase